MTRRTPELAHPSRNFRTTPARGRLAAKNDLDRNRPHTHQGLSENGFRIWNPLAPKLRPYHQTTAAPLLHGMQAIVLNPLLHSSSHLRVRSRVS
ncbi:hypothetical protein AVEN_105913-1 [Araneus ventricosus]|uniref:Uncharacterized protein n=1 Tax=Araneus ventricosus TaxID=182803 RepID=A0A4Y2QW67_ARAVE|nr:hypothetical protein AVEN_105913-1 [Araneus ventricosus]